MKLKTKFKRKLKKILNKIFTEKRKDIVILSAFIIAVGIIGTISQLHAKEIAFDTNTPLIKTTTMTELVEPNRLPENVTKVTTKPNIIIGAKGSIADRLNNPGNLRYAGQKGATEGDYGFAKFKTLEDGWKALLRQVRIDQNRDFTIEQFVNKYAPPAENDTNKYIETLTSNLKINKLTNISDINTQELDMQVMKAECGGYVN
jgi:hypothetical protein